LPTALGPDDMGTHQLGHLCKLGIGFLLTFIFTGVETVMVLCQPGLDLDL
jgi:hypothetical protein